MTRNELLDSFGKQAKNCADGGSPLYANLLNRILAVDIESESGPIWKYLAPHAESTITRSLLPLRFLALFHKLALNGSFPALAAVYPSCCGDGASNDADAAYSAISAATSAWDPRDLDRHMPERVQTNEVGRCRSLMPGFRAIASAVGERLPWRLLELGSSAGLNLFWDQYGFPGTPEGVVIASRRGCDIAPAAATEEQLLPFVWPDQVERFQTLRRALQQIAGQRPLPVDAADAVEWAEQQLHSPQTGVVTVLFHSIFWIYLDTAAKEKLEKLIREAGSRATPDAPFAWLRMEPASYEYAAIDLTMWPAQTVRVATSGFHGNNVVVIGGPSPE